MKKIFLFIILISIICISGCSTITPPQNIQIQKFNETPYNCTLLVEGNIYYNNITNNVLLCNGTNWRNI